MKISFYISVAASGVSLILSIVLFFFGGVNQGLQADIQKQQAELQKQQEQINKGEAISQKVGPELLRDKADPAERWGFLAHELQATLLPTAATGEKDAPNLVQSPDLMALTAALCAALQEAMARIEAVEGKL